MRQQFIQEFLSLLDGKSPKVKESSLVTSPSFDEEANRLDLKITFPNLLKIVLADDCDCVTRHSYIVTLPAKITVEGLFEDYLNYKSGCADFTLEKGEILLEYVSTIKECFNTLLGLHLLYKFERLQFARVKAEHPDTPLCKIYGVIHLLRLFVKLDEFLPTISLDVEMTRMLVLNINDLLRYLQINCNRYFDEGNHLPANTEYRRKALNN